MAVTAGIDCMACIANLVAGCPDNGRTSTVFGVTHAMTESLTTKTDGKGRLLPTLALPVHVFNWVDAIDRWVFDDNGLWRWAMSSASAVVKREVDCMACIANPRGIEHQGVYTDRAGVTHATMVHESYGRDQALLCSARGDGSLTLVPR